MPLKKDIEKIKKEMFDDINSITVDDLKSNELVIMIGGKTISFTDFKVGEKGDVEKNIRKDYREKLNTQQAEIREKINAKINQLLLLHQNKQKEIERKEIELKKRYSKAAMMPDINSIHYLKGLSVIKGDSNDELLWIYNAVYNPPYINIYDKNGTGKYKTKEIPKRLLDRMKRDILICITTKGDKITSIKTKEYDDKSKKLVIFYHYHQTNNGSDCWGKWKYNTTWSTVDDILNVAKDAEAVLETINTGSIATRGPKAMPKLATITKAVENLVDVSEKKRRKRRDDDEDIWNV